MPLLCIQAIGNYYHTTMDENVKLDETSTIIVKFPFKPYDPFCEFSFTSKKISRLNA
jgi:hypothetical protein